MKKVLPFIACILIFGNLQTIAQDVFWFEDFDSGAATRWDVTGNVPTPVGIVGLTYGTNVKFDNFVINDANTLQLDGNLVIGSSISSQGQFIQGRHDGYGSPNDLPNPFFNSGTENNSLHITARAGCPGLLYAGNATYDHWNCLTLIGNDANIDLAETEQFSAYNTNIDATGKCNIKLTADFYLGGSANGLEAHSTILYSINAGVTWKIVQDNLATCNHSMGGTANNWFRRTFELPADADGEPDLRIAFRWTEDGNTNDNTQDYVSGGSFNVDNVMLSACNKPNTNFAMDITGDACKGQTITLFDSSTTNAGIYSNCGTILTDNCSITTYLWLITGPGTITYINGTTSADASPQVKVDANGSYDVTLTASNCAGDSTLVKTAFITAAACPPAVDFTSDEQSACTAPAAKQDTITFTDLHVSYSAFVSRVWSFTPAAKVTYVLGTSATDSIIKVVFDSSTTYDVKLKIANSEGIDSLTKTAYIKVITCECVAVGGAPVATNVFVEDFDGNGAAINNWGTLSTTLGTEGAVPNTFVISNVGSGTDNDLHIASTVGDAGYAYFEFGGGTCTTDRRSESNSINTTGVTGLTLSYSFIENGNGATDNATVEYSIDDGATWIMLSDMSKPGATWTAFSSVLPATCENITILKIAFHWVNLDDGVAFDPPFAVDDISIDGTTAPTGAGSPPNTWEGTADNSWNNTANWSDGTVPSATDTIIVPTAADLVGTFMPTISASAVAKNVCNYGTITLDGDNTLTINKNLLNEGAILTTTANNTADVLFVTDASSYLGSGTMNDVDVSVTSSNLTLESNLTARSLNISTTGTMDIGGNTLSLNKNITKTAGTFTATGGTINLIDACGSCTADPSSNAILTFNADQAFGDVIVNKTAGVKTELTSGIVHSFTTPKTLTIQSGILDANTNTLNGTGNLTMTGGELQIAKNATVVPEISGAYTLTGGKVTFDGGAQTTKVSLTPPISTVFSEDFENPDIGGAAVIDGNIVGWSEGGPSSTSIINNEGSGLTIQTASFTIPQVFASTLEIDTLISSSFDFGAATNNPTLSFDYEIIDNSFAQSVLTIQVLQKTSSSNPWTVQGSVTGVGSGTNQSVTLTNASSDFYVAFRFIQDATAGVANGGTITIDNISVTGEGTGASFNYHDVEYAGTGIKSLDGGNLYVNNQLTLNLPTALANYVDPSTDTVKVLNAAASAVSRTGGHIAGHLNRSIATGSTYTFDVGTDHADVDADTYYEPITVTTNSMASVTNITANFNGNRPTVDTVADIKFVVSGPIPLVIDSITTMETEGYWHLSPNTNPSGGNYDVTVAPDTQYWSMTNAMGTGYHALLKQDTEGQPWDFNNGGIRQSDAVTNSFSDFSNYGLGFATAPVSIPLGEELLLFRGEATPQGNLLNWTILISDKADYFEVERSEDGNLFKHLGVVSASDYDDAGYRMLDKTPYSKTYYRLKQIDTEGEVKESKVIVVENKFKGELAIYPNPANDLLNISLENEVIKSIQIYNNIGELVSTTTNSNQVDVSLLNSGIYVVKVTSVNETLYIEKLVKQ